MKSATVNRQLITHARVSIIFTWMLLILVLFLNCQSISKSDKFISSKLQLSLIERFKENSKQKSDESYDTNLQLFSDPYFYQYLREFDDGSQLYKLNPKELLSRFYNELSVMELVHNFNSQMYTVEYLGTHSFLYNDWQTQVTGLKNFTFGGLPEETDLFGFPPFESGPYKPTFLEASERPFYGGLNVYRNSIGNPALGEVALVLNKKMIANQMLGSAIDSGIFRFTCKSRVMNGPVHCDGVIQDSSMVLVPPFIHHSIDPFISYFDPIFHPTIHYKFYNLARLVIRSLSRMTYSTETPISLEFWENRLGFFELNPITRMDLPQAVTMVIGVFDQLWGTKNATLLREVCIKQKWLLVWGTNHGLPPLGSHNTDTRNKTIPFPITNQTYDSNLRILDPFVIKSLQTNISIPHDIGVKFELFFTAGDVKRWSDMKKEFTQSVLAIEPLMYGDCASEDCMGVLVSDRSCVCKY
ncbi:hypothetical protein BC833DRAFT_607559 [Globomyces pollinis-pini]|nr:hypothetical protein BC833DRAFT_607559 [Globomyces pollinis-pini]